MVPACSSATLTNVLPHRNAMQHTQDMAPHPVTVYRHGANLSLCYPLMWNVTQEYTANHFNVFGKTRPGNPSLAFHTRHWTLNSIMLLWWLSVGSSVESSVPTRSWTRSCGVGNHYTIRSPTAAPPVTGRAPERCWSRLLICRPDSAKWTRSAPVQFVAGNAGRHNTYYHKRRSNENRKWPYDV